MKVILTEKITKLGNIGDTVEVKTGYARNYLLPNNKAMRCTKENLALFEAKKAELVARHEKAKKDAESKVSAVKNAKLHMIRQAGDTGQLYGSVSSRDIARALKEIAYLLNRPRLCWVPQLNLWVHLIQKSHYIQTLSLM